VCEPKASLLDEPLSNLDAKMLTHMRTEINKLHQELGATFVYVTHDQVEAMTMGTLIVVMKDGVIQQADNAYQLYRQPKNKFVAGFIGTPQMNFIDVTISHAQGRVDACFGVHRIALPQRLLTTLTDGAQYTMGVRAEDVKTDENEAQMHPEQVFEGYVRVIEQLGNEVLLYIEVGGAEEMLIARASARKLWVRDAHIRLALDPEGIHLFDKTTEESVVLGQR
jgi:multiple sugar transport system ATP-binding protein